MTKSIAICAAIFLLTSCGTEEKRTIPSDVLDEETMIVVLAETQMLNAKLQHRDSRRKRFTDFVKLDHQALYDSLNITKEEVDRSMNFYLKDYDQMQDLHDKALNLLSARISRLKAAGHQSTEVTVPGKDSTAIKDVLKRER